MTNTKNNGFDIFGMWSDRTIPVWTNAATWAGARRVMREGFPGRTGKIKIAGPGVRKDRQPGCTAHSRNCGC